MKFPLVDLPNIGDEIYCQSRLLSSMFLLRVTGYGDSNGGGITVEMELVIPSEIRRYKRMSRGKSNITWTRRFPRDTLYRGYDQNDIDWYRDNNHVIS